MCFSYTVRIYVSSVQQIIVLYVQCDVLLERSLLHVLFCRFVFPVSGDVVVSWQFDRRGTFRIHVDGRSRRMAARADAPTFGAGARHGRWNVGAVHLWPGRDLAGGLDFFTVLTARSASS